MAAEKVLTAEYKSGSGSNELIFIIDRNSIDNIYLKAKYIRFPRAQRFSQHKKYIWRTCTSCL